MTEPRDDDAAALRGSRTLLIVIPRSDPREARFFVGTVEPIDGGISLLDGHMPVYVRTPSEAIRPFDPEMLERVVTPDAFERLRAWTFGVEACLPLFADSAPVGGLILHDAFYGLAEDAVGSPLLFQGDAELWREAFGPEEDSGEADVEA